MNTPEKKNTIKRSLLCTLTDEERRNYGIKLATTLDDIEAVEAEKKRTVDHYKDRIAGLTAAASDISRKVSTGQEWRDVECRIDYGVPDKLHKQVVRLDTLEVVATEVMTEADKQLRLPIEENTDDAGEGESDAESDESDPPWEESEPGFDPNDYGNLSYDELDGDLQEFLEEGGTKPRDRAKWLADYFDGVYDDVPACFVRFAVTYGGDAVTPSLRVELEKALGKFLKSKTGKGEG